MAKLTRREQQVAEEFFAQLQSHGVSVRDIETVLGNTGSAMPDLAEAIKTVAKAVASISPYAELGRGSLSRLAYDSLIQRGVTTSGVLQCLSVIDLKKIRNISTKGIEELKHHLGNMRLRRTTEDVATRIKDVYSNPKLAPISLAELVGPLVDSDIEQLQKAGLKTLGDFERMARTRLEQVVASPDRLQQLETFLSALSISLK